MVRVILDDALDHARNEVMWSLQEHGDSAQKVVDAARAIEAVEELRGQIAEFRRDAVRRLRFPTGDWSVRPARTWDEIGQMIGVTYVRAQQLADLPSTRSGGLRPPYRRSGT